MRVSVFGIGYVGCVTAACLARQGHEVVGVDVDSYKVAALNEGRAPFFERTVATNGDLNGEILEHGQVSKKTRPRVTLKIGSMAHHPSRKQTILPLWAPNITRT